MTVPRPSARLFEKDDVKHWRKAVWKEVHRLKLDPEKDRAVVQATFVIATIANFGTDRTVLAELTGLPDAAIVTVLRRLRQQRILVGQKLRASWAKRKGFESGLGLVLDAMTAAGDLSRAKDEKRSAAQRAKKRASTMPRASRRRRSLVTPGAIFTPAVVKSNPLIGLAEWEKK